MCVCACASCVWLKYDKRKLASVANNILSVNQTNKRTNAWMNEWMNERKKRQKKSQKNRRKNGKKVTWYTHSTHVNSTCLQHVRRHLHANVTCTHCCRWVFEHLNETIDVGVVFVLVVNFHYIWNSNRTEHLATGRLHPTVVMAAAAAFCFSNHN